jgi:pseudaminic acid cytidylyltransferase
MSNICIIPARGGSKRIPRKNIKSFLGKPIIAYSIKAAIESKIFDEIIVSTDDEEIAEIAIKYGATVPFYRSKKNSDDYSTTVDVLIEVVEKLKEKGITYENLCCIYPTAPFVSSALIKNGFDLLKNYKSIFTATKFSFPIQRSLVYRNEKIQMLYPENINVRSQDLEPTFHDCGQLYWIKISDLLKEQKLYTDNSTIIEVKETDCQDIDNETDWEIAELKFKRNNK